MKTLLIFLLFLTNAYASTKLTNTFLVSIKLQEYNDKAVNLKSIIKSNQESTMTKTFGNGIKQTVKFTPSKNSNNKTMSLSIKIIDQITGKRTVYPPRVFSLTDEETLFQTFSANGENELKLEIISQNK